jgi:Putative beta-barrel porin-2, OmpL-like. bbp2
MADVYFQHDFAGEPPRYRAFDVNTGLSLDFARLTLAHAPDPIGLRLDVGVGDTPNAYFRSDPASISHPDLARALSYFEQAFATAKIPAGHGLSIDVGKFGTPVGFEDNETPPNWNYSRGLLFTLAEPTYHAGVRATYPAAGSLAFSVFWLNGWNTNVIDGNGMRSFAAAVTAKPDDAVELVLVYAGGPERAPTQLGAPILAFRNVLDGYVEYDLTDALKLAATADYGIDASRGGVSYWGAGGYVQCWPLPWLGGALRGEYFDDPRGFTTGTPQQIEEGTATLEARTRIGDASFIGRLEYRHDRSDRAVFPVRNGLPSPRQNTLTLGTMATF